MRGVRHKPQQQEKRIVQRMLPGRPWIPVPGYSKLHSCVSRSMTATKNWGLSTDFKNNVAAALEREKQK